MRMLALLLFALAARPASPAIHYSNIVPGQKCVGRTMSVRTALAGDEFRRLALAGQRPWAALAGYRAH
jgi:hypothetical protein